MDENNKVMSLDEVMAALARLTDNRTTDDELMDTDSIITTIKTWYDGFNDGQKQVNDIDASWRKRYRDRFFGNVDDVEVEVDAAETVEEFVEDDTKKGIDSLFNKEG